MCAVVLLLLDDPPPGEMLDWMEAEVGHYCPPSRSNSSPGPRACWLHPCDGLCAPTSPPPLASVRHLTLHCPPHPPALTRQSCLPQPIVNFAIASHSGCCRHRLPCPRPLPLPDLVVPPPAPSLAHPLPPTTLSSPTPRGMFFRPGEMPINCVLIVLYCLPLQETSRL